MRKILITVAILLIGFDSQTFAQITGNSVHFDSRKSKFSSRTKLKEFNDEQFKNNLKLFFASNKNTLISNDILDSIQTKSFHTMKFYKINNDAKVSKELNDKLEKIQSIDNIDSKVDSLTKIFNETNTTDSGCCKVKIFATGGADPTTTNLSQGTGNLAIGAMIKLGNGNKSWREFYAMYNAHAANSSDTSLLQKTFLFPEIGKRLLVIGYAWVSTVPNSCFQIVPFGEVSYNKITSSNDSSAFYSISPTLGCRFELHNDNVRFGDTSAPFILSFVPYYNLISTDPKYFSATNNVYNEILNDKHLPPTFHSVGLTTSLQLSNFQIFANVKYVMNTKSDSSINSIGSNNVDLKGLGIIIGAVINTDIINFGNF